MRSFKKTFGLLVFIFLLSNSLSANKQDHKFYETGKFLDYVIVSNLKINLVSTGETLSVEEIKMLSYMREEEKLARDVYTTFYEKYEIPIFNNISKSEQFHMDQILDLLNQFELEDPASEEIGVFNHSGLQSLFDSLILKGSQSLEDALYVGATIEDIDIFDLTNYIDKTQNESINQVFMQLRCGSTHHMKAFYNLLTKRNIEYKPQYIDEISLSNIIEGTFEPCSVKKPKVNNYKEGKCRRNK